MSLINGCSIALQWQISQDDLDLMDSYFQTWHEFLRQSIARGALDHRVFTFNNHYLCPLKFLIQRMGPLRAYSCRSLERSIKVFTNLIKATKNVAVNASNVFNRQLDYRRHNIQQLYLKHFPSKRYDPESYRVHPDAATSKCNLGELLAPFKSQTILPMNSRSSDRYVCFGLSQTKVINALVKYYNNLKGQMLNARDICWGTLEMAAAVEKDGVVCGSVMDRKLRHLTTRGNHAVLFRGMRKVRSRSVGVWLVGIVQCYITHVQDGKTRFLAIAEVMGHHHLDPYNIITVTKSAPDAQKLAVFSTEDIIESVGLVRYNQNPRKYKVTWPHIKYFEGVEYLEIGRHTDV